MMTKDFHVEMSLKHLASSCVGVSGLGRVAVGTLLSVQRHRLLREIGGLES